MKFADHYNYSVNDQQIQAFSFLKLSRKAHISLCNVELHDQIKDIHFLSHLTA